MSNPTLEDILRKIPARSLVQLAESDKNLASAVEEASTNKKGERKPLANADARKIIQHEIRRIATKILAETMTTKQRAEAVAKLNIDHEQQGNNPKSSRVHKKRLLEALDASGVEDFLKENVDVDALVEIGEAFELELAAKSGADKLASQINNQIEYEAAAAFLESFSNSVLLDVAFEMKLLASPTATAANGTVVEAILTETEVKELKKEKTTKKKAVKVSKTKPKLAKGVTYEDVFQWYTVEELKEFAKDNELLVSGTKKELIKRIIAWFEGDKENTTVEGKKEKLAAKKKTTKKSSAKKSSKKSGDEKEEKTETKPTKKETAAAKKEAAAAAKKEATAAAAEEGEKEPEDELDLDKLNQYDLAKLKKYCSDEKIEVSGRTKQAYIDAINAYNQEEDEEAQ